jgi:cation diffusion facilitator CzcD-associated flavoprotein CzcO
MAVKLKAVGASDFTIFEAEGGPGGTWYRNTYPGAEVDVPSNLYSLSFASRNWTRTHAKQPELATYIDDIVNDHDLRDHLRFNTRVESAVWDDERHVYDVTTSDGNREAFDILVAAVGFLSDPRIPDWPGLENFEGPAFHTQYWDHSIDLTGRKVALVGNGSTATQIAPELAEIVDELHIFQREPGWILPKGDRDYTREELQRNASRLRRRVNRAKILAQTQWAYVGGAVHHSGSRRNRKAEERARAYIAATFVDRPDLRDKVTPRYPFSGKRRILQGTYYPTLLRDNVVLHDAPVEKIVSDGIIDARGDIHGVHAIVIATGFNASQYLSTLEVRGRGGRRLQQKWARSAYAFLGMMVDEFPNMYVFYGPNTNGGPILLHHELQADYVVANMRRMRRGHGIALEVKRRYVERYNSWLQRRFTKTAWAHANNYMKGPDGRVVTQWADGVVRFWLLHKLLRIPSTTASRRGRPRT